MAARRIVGIDPGPTESGLVVLDPDKGVVFARVMRNKDVLERFVAASVYQPNDGLAIEWVSSFGMPVGREVFETCLWAGRYLQAWPYPDEATLIPRAEVKLALCGSSRAKDGNIRQALLDLFPATGGGETPQVGTRGKPGPLYGVATHTWAALAVAVVASWREAQRDGAPTPLYAAPTPLEQLCSAPPQSAHEKALEVAQAEKAAQAERERRARIRPAARAPRMRFQA